MRRAGVEPDVEDVASPCRTPRRRTSGRRSPAGSRSFASRVVPGVGALALEDVGHVAQQLGASAAPRRSPCSRRPGSARPRAAGARCTSRGASRSCCGCAPRPRPGTSATWRDRLERLLAQRRPSLVEGDEPLLGGAEDDRVLAAPADRVGVACPCRPGAARPSRAGSYDHRRVGVEDLLAGEALDLGQEAARLVDRAVDVEAVARRRSGSRPSRGRAPCARRRCRCRG